MLCKAAQAQGSWRRSWAWATLCTEFCILSLWYLGFSLGSHVSFHWPKICRQFDCSKLPLYVNEHVHVWCSEMDWNPIRGQFSCYHDWLWIHCDSNQYEAINNEWMNERIHPKRTMTTPTSTQLFLNFHCVII